MESDNRKHLRRLDAAYYKGHDSYVHWTMSIDGRRTGWLDQRLHMRLREVLLHSLVRYHLLCPVYVLMPDHAHFLLMGFRDTSAHLPAVALLRKHWNQLLKPDFHLQHQAYDRVVREHDREREAFQKLAQYISDNPVRGNLVSQRNAYPYWGSLFPGYPSLDPRKENFWNSFWLSFNKLVAGCPPRPREFLA